MVPHGATWAPLQGTCTLRSYSGIGIGPNHSLLPSQPDDNSAAARLVLVPSPKGRGPRQNPSAVAQPRAWNEGSRVQRKVESLVEGSLVEQSRKARQLEEGHTRCHPRLRSQLLARQWTRPGSTSTRPPPTVPHRRCGIGIVALLRALRAPVQIICTGGSIPSSDRFHAVRSRVRVGPVLCGHGQCQRSMAGLGHPSPAA